MPWRIDIPPVPLGLGKRLISMLDWTRSLFGAENVLWRHRVRFDRSPDGSRGKETVEFHFMQKEHALEFEQRWAAFRPILIHNQSSRMSRRG
jgi:hypothetical protein